MPYPRQAKAIQDLADVAGEDALKKAYFGGDTHGLLQAVDKKRGEGTFLEFAQMMEQGEFDKASDVLAGRGSDFYDAKTEELDPGS